MQSMSFAHKRRASARGLLVGQPNSSANTINEDDYHHHSSPFLPMDGSAETGTDRYAAIISAIAATEQQELERCNERNRCVGPPDESALDHKFDRLLSEVHGLRDQIGDRIETLNRRLTQTNRLFLAHQDYGQRSNRAGDLLLIGVPTTVQGEGLRECYVRIARRLGYAESEIPIVHIRRLEVVGSSSCADVKPSRYSVAVLDNIARTRAGKLARTGSIEPSVQPPAVHVQFVFRNARNEFYRRYQEGGRAGTGLALQDLGYGGADGRVYVSENLTRGNVSLKAEAMRLKRDGKIKSVFTVNGQIYVKRTVDHRPELVTSSVDLLLLDETKMKANKDCYPRVLEHIINTQSPQVLCRDYKEILGTLDIISTDPDESVRLYLACWLQKYCASWFDRDQDQQSIFSKAFLEKILQIIVRYLTDEPNVRASTFESLTYLIEKGYLDRATTIKLNIVEELVSKPINEQFMDMCTNYIHLMVKIAPLVGCAKTHELLYTRFVKMCTCKINFVRKECATAFPVMCEVLGNEVFEKNLLPIFMKLCEDEIWTVRKACAEVMPFIALLCTLEKRRKVLVPAYKKFMFDTSLWVIKAALKNLGRFLATFAQLQILGLAYNSSLELSITNAADEAFQELMGNARQLATGSQQPAASVLLKNYESYEQRFKDSIQRHALLSLVKSADDESSASWKATSPRSEDCINVAAYLASVVFVEEHLSQRQSTGSTSDDGGGGISKLTDLFFVRHKSLSSSSSIASTSPTPSPLYRANQSYDEKNPLNRFMRYCSPLKNNFEHAFANPSGSDGGDQGGGSDAFDNHGHWDSEDDNFGSNHLPDLSLAGVDVEAGEGGGSGVIYDSDNPKHQQADGGGGGAGGLDFIMEAGAEEDENAIDECFNSHQFWYISPGLALDLEFIDKEETGTAGDEASDASNNNVRERNERRSSRLVEAKAAPLAGATATDDSKNNNLTQQQAGGGSTGSGNTEPSPTAATGGETGPSSAAMVVEDNENQNDSDSSYGSINNNETDNNKLIYMYEDLLPSQSQSSAAAAAANSSNNNAGAGTAAAGAASGGAGSSSSTVTPTMTTVERIRAAEQLKTLIRWENEEVEWNLLEDFLHMKNVNMELCQDCAYNFPAVVLTFGDKFWPILSRYFFDLCGDVQDSVRRTMAASISKIALIIGREQATRDLVPSYTEFLLDSDDIKFEVVRTLAEFLRVIDACEHETLMNHLGMCLQPPLSMMNWRFRELVGQQIMELARMHTAIRKENCLLFLTGLSMRLMLDKYDSVRKAGIDAFVECSHEFQQNDKVFEFFNKHFASYSNWRRRQTYVIAAGKMLETDRVEVKIFRKHVFNNVLKLADDAVPNVRIQVAKCLKEIIAPHPNFANDPQVEPTLQKLRTDKDCDVRGHIDGYQSLEEEMAAGGGCGGSGASNASTMMMTSGDSESHHESSSSSSSPSPSPSPSAARSLTNSSVSLRLSYAEATSGFSSLMLDDQQFYSGEQQQQRHQRQQQADEERELKDGEGEEVQLAAGAGATGACSSERGVDVANVEMHGVAGAGMVERHNDHDNGEDDECGEEAIEQPTSSMSTDDDAAYCSEMETSSAVSTPSAAPAATLATIPSQNVPLASGSSSSSSSQVVPSSDSIADDLSSDLVNGESVPTTPPSRTTAGTGGSAAAKKGADSNGGNSGSNSSTPKMRDNFFKRRSKGKK